VCRLVTTDLPPMISSAASARRWVAEHLERWELLEAADVAVLLTSELVANAIVHARSGPGLVLAVADGVIEVGVSDDEPRLPRATPPQLPISGQGIDEPRLAEGSRGLLLVKALADEWGATSLVDGKQVWFRLSAEGWAYRSACRCHSDDLDQVRLGSGHYALAILGPWDTP
jgi:anti-sigma regulatory factor (Ser/Thr protein kinase)